MTLQPLTQPEIEKLNAQTNQPIADIAISNRVLTARVNMTNELINVYDNVIDQHNFIFARNMFKRAFGKLTKYQLESIDELLQSENIYENLNTLVDAMRMDKDATNEKNTALLIELTNYMLPVFNKYIKTIYQIINDFGLTQYNPYLKLNNYPKEKGIFYTFNSILEHQADLIDFKDAIEELKQTMDDNSVEYVMLVGNKIQLPNLQFTNMLDTLVYDAKNQLLENEE